MSTRLRLRWTGEVDFGLPAAIATLIWCWAGSLTWWALLLVAIAGTEVAFKTR